MEYSLSGIGVLDKAARIIDALEAGPPLGLAELSAFTRLPRATAHRLALALEVHGFVERDGAGRFAPGPRLAVRSLTDVAGPVLERLRDATGESAQLYVPRGDRRLCLLSLESRNSLRTIVPVGELLPMTKGSAAKVLSPRFTGAWAESIEEREKGVASVSAPVRDAAGAVVAAVSVSGPVERTTRAPGKKYAKAVVRAAQEVEAALNQRGGRATG